MENSGVTAVVARPAHPTTWWRPLRCDASHARSKMEKMEWRAGLAAVVFPAALATRRNRKLRSGRFALEKEAPEQMTFEYMVDHIRREDPSKDPTLQEGKWITGLTCPRCNGGRKKEKSFSCIYNTNFKPSGVLWGSCWRKNKCGWQAKFHPARDLSFSSGSRGGSERHPIRKPVETAPVADLGREVEDLMQEHIDFFQTRGISQSVLDRNHIGSKHTKKGDAIVFPYFRDGKLVAEKMRALPKIFWQSKGNQKCLYGLDDLKNADEIIITEGEIDKLSFEEAGIRSAASVQMGCSTKFQAPDLAILAGSPRPRVVLAVDGDSAGQECCKNLAAQLKWRRCYKVIWPEGCKDANEVLLKYGAAKLRTLVKEAELIQCPWGNNLSDEETFKKVNARIDGTMDEELVCGVKPGWTSLDRLWRPVPGELTVVTGIPGHGKSEFLLSLVVNLSKLHGWRALLFAFEATVDNLVRQMFLKAKHTVRELQDSDENKEYQKVLNWVDDHIIVESEFAAEDDVTLDGILKTAVTYVKEENVNLLVIDPYNFIERSQEEVKELEHVYIGTLLQRLRRFAEEHRLHVIIVAHPTKASQWDGAKPNLYSIAGSSNWFNKTDNGIVLHRREFEDESGRMTPTNQLEIRVEKVRNREAGQLGKTTLVFNEATRCLDDLPHQPLAQDTMFHGSQSTRLLSRSGGVSETSSHAPKKVEAL